MGNEEDYDSEDDSGEFDELENLGYADYYASIKD